MKRKFESRQSEIDDIEALSDAYNQNEDFLNIGKINTTFPTITWLEEQFRNQRNTDEEVYYDMNKQVLLEFHAIKKEVNLFIFTLDLKFSSKTWLKRMIN